METKVLLVQLVLILSSILPIGRKLMGTIGKKERESTAESLSISWPGPTFLVSLKQALAGS